jgi:hypothetical protein
LGGADKGTNRYYVKDLYYNPYIIMSEATFHCIEVILEVYRGLISYEALYGAVQRFCTGKEDGTSIYGEYINHLFQNPADRDLPNLYSTYCDRLSDYIEEQTGFPINIIWETHFINLFEEKLTDNNTVNSDSLLFPFLFSFLSTLGLLERIKVVEEKFGYSQFVESSYELDEGEKWESTLVGFAIEAAHETYQDSPTDKKALLKGSYLTERIFALLPPQ